MTWYEPPGVFSFTVVSAPPAIHALSVPLIPWSAPQYNPANRTCEQEGKLRSAVDELKVVFAKFPRNSRSNNMSRMLAVDVFVWLCTSTAIVLLPFTNFEAATWIVTYSLVPSMLVAGVAGVR